MNWFFYILNNTGDLLSRFIKSVYNLIPDSMKSRYGVSSDAFKNMIFFVGGILRHWYFLVAVPAVIVTYTLFEVLREKGIIDAFERTVQKGLDSVMYISKICFPYILDMHAMLRCINGAP